jgi:hypothetical protein
MAHCPPEKTSSTREHGRPLAVDVACRSRHTHIVGVVASCSPLPFGVGRTPRNEDTCRVLRGRQRRAGYIMHHHSCCAVLCCALCGRCCTTSWTLENALDTGDEGCMLVRTIAATSHIFILHCIVMIVRLCHARIDRQGLCPNDAIAMLCFSYPTT